MNKTNGKIEIKNLLIAKARATSDSPGVYRMLDKDGKILYIGKAKYLQNRVRTYFQNNIEDPKTQLLMAKVRDFDVILTSSEAEALVLESILIKKHKPRYNILLKDDKSYPYVVIDETHTFPKIIFTRRPRKTKKQKIFGPFASAYSLREAIRFINASFRLRDCSDSEFANRSRPCINYQIGICSGPCVGLISPNDYQKDLQQAARLLSGHGGEALRAMKEEMERLASEENFERAAAIRDQLTRLEETLAPKKRSAVESTAYEKVDRDILGWHRKESSACIALLFVRGGNLVDSTTFHFDGIETRSDQEILFSFLAQFYLTGNKLDASEAEDIGDTALPGAEGKTVPEEILLPFAVDEAPLLEQGLEQLGHKTKILLPQRGLKHDLLEMAQKNADHGFEEKQREKGSIYRVLSELKVRLRLENYPRRMECFDISNLGDTGIVASRVTFIEGQPDKSLYRHYKIQSVETQNDFAAMKEVISRRLLKSVSTDGEPKEEPPDLLIIDGGKGQLAMAMEVIEELNITGIDVVSLAKAKTTSDFDNREVEKSFERVFKPGRMNPITLAPDSAVCHLMQRIRDEAHRFAITFQRKQRKF